MEPRVNPETSAVKVIIAGSSGLRTQWVCLLVHLQLRCSMSACRQTAVCWVMFLLFSYTHGTVSTQHQICVVHKSSTYRHTNCNTYKLLSCSGVIICSYPYIFISQVQTYEMLRQFCSRTSHIKFYQNQINVSGVMRRHIIEFNVL